MDRREFLLQSVAVAVGTAAGEHARSWQGFLAVWKRGGPEEVHVPFQDTNLSLLYPLNLGSVIASGGIL